MELLIASHGKPQTSHPVTPFRARKKQNKDPFILLKKKFFCLSKIIKFGTPKEHTQK